MTRNGKVCDVVCETRDLRAFRRGQFASIGTMLEKDVCNLPMPTLRCQTERSYSIFVLGNYICAALNEHANDFDLSPFRRQMQWSTPVLVLGYHIYTMLNEHA